MKLAAILEAQVAPPPEAALAGSLAGAVGPQNFTRPALHEPDPGADADAEPIRKAATARKRRHREYNREQAPPPGP